MYKTEIPVREKKSAMSACASHSSLNSCSTTTSRADTVSGMADTTGFFWAVEDCLEELACRRVAGLKRRKIGLSPFPERVEHERHFARDPA
eukprot:4653678-Pleurochrysis_carterae.AAC.2